MPIHDILAPVTDVRVAGTDTVHIVFEAPEIASLSRPGQFLMVGFPSPFSDPFLRRPLAIAGASLNRIEILVRVAGWGTALISNVSPGDSLPVLGPLGNGFMEPTGRTILAAGGIGVAPLLYAHSHWDNTVLCYGESGASYLCETRGNENKCRLCTEDGSLGIRGLVTDILEDEIEKGASAIYACGPLPMLKRTYEITKSTNIDCYVSLEERMACGIGVCQGCVVPVDGEYKRVCRDGPVFDAGLIDWEVLND